MAADRIAAGVLLVLSLLLPGCASTTGAGASSAAKKGPAAKALPPVWEPEAWWPGALRETMTVVAETTGSKCTHCHRLPAYEERTAMRERGAICRDRFVFKLVRAGDGGPVDCAFCHEGRSRFVDRSDRDVTKEWMRETFVARLRPKDGGTMSCLSCHARDTLQIFARP